MTSLEQRARVLPSPFGMAQLAASAAWILIYFDTALPAVFRIALAATILTFVLIRAARLFISPQKIYLDAASVTLVAGALIFAALQTINSIGRGVLVEGLPYLMIIAAVLPISILATLLPNDTAMKSFQNISTLFSVAVILMGTIFYIDIQTFFEALSVLNIDRGFFGAKKNVEGDEFANVYFPATLLLVPHCIYATQQRRWLKFILGIIALFIAPSRFGVAIVSLFAALMLLSGSKSTFGQLRLKRILQRTISVAFAIILPASLTFQLANFQLSDDGWSIRLAHLHAVINEFEDAPGALFFGFGAGSTFYTAGFGAITDNIEISQLELIRKYGLIGFSIISAAIFFIIFESVKRRGLGSAYALGAYYICAFSNPVLLTLGSVLLCASSLRSNPHPEP